MSAPKFGEWLPIETAPKQAGTIAVILGLWDGEVGGKRHEVESAVAELYRSGTWFLSGAEYYSVSCFNPTHWMPLPPPPTSNNETKD